MMGAAVVAEFIIEGKSGACDVLTGQTATGSLSPGIAPSGATWCKCLPFAPGNIFWVDFEHF